MPSADELRALAERMDVLETRERASAEAKAAYENDPSPENYARYRTAVDALAEGRREFRESPIAVIAAQAGSTTIIAGTMSTNAAPVVPDVAGEGQ